MRAPERLPRSLSAVYEGAWRAPLVWLHGWLAALGSEARDRIEGVQLAAMLAKASLSAPARARLYRKLAGMARTGMPLPRALDALWQLASRGGRAPRAPLAVITAAWRRQVYDGRSFGEALGGWVPRQESMIVEAGASELEQALEDAAALADSTQRMRKAVSHAVGYPLFLGVLLGALMWIFSVEAIPAFAEVKPMDQWTGMAAGMGILSGLVRHGLLPLAGVVVVAAGGTWWSLPRWTGPWRTRFDDLPPWSLYRLVMGTGFLTAMVALLRAGMPVPEALRRLRLTANPWLAERIDAALYFLNSGHDLGESLHLAGHAFPDREIVEDLRIYAALGNLEEALKRIAAEWVKQGLDSLQTIGDAMKVAGMVVVAVVITWIQLGLIAVQQQLTSGF